MPHLARLWLCAYLLGWVPLNYAAEVSRTLPLIDLRGLPASIELFVHGIITALAAVAGWMLWARNPAARTAVPLGALAATAMSIQSLYWSVLPHDVSPGTKLPLALVAGLHCAAWVLYLRGREAA